MRTIRGIVWATGVAVTAACGSGNDITTPSVSADLICVNPTSSGVAVTCSLTLPEEAGVKVVVTDHKTCEAAGDLFVITAPVAGTLTADGCSETKGKQIDLGGVYPLGTPVTFEFTPGLLITGSPGIAAVRIKGRYPQWTLNLEDALGSFPGVAQEYEDLVVTVTVTPTTGS